MNGKRDSRYLDGGRRLGRLSALLLVALVAGSPAVVGADAPVRAPTLADCQSLIHQFDVAWPAQRDSVRASTARHSRDLGETDCRQGKIAEGVHHLRRALHDIGVKPVRVVPGPARR